MQNNNPFFFLVARMVNQHYKDNMTDVNGRTSFPELPELSVHPGVLRASFFKKKIMINQSIVIMYPTD